MFKPWSIISITIAIVLAFVLWANMIRFEYALVVATATAAAASLSRSVTNPAAPAPASAVATAEPIPPAAPVTNAERPVRSK